MQNASISVSRLNHLVPPLSHSCFTSRPSPFVTCIQERSPFIQTMFANSFHVVQECALHLDEEEFLRETSSKEKKRRATTDL